MSEMNHDHHDHDELEMKKALRPQVERDNKYWLSLEQWGGDPEFAKQAETEFQSSPLREGDKEDGWARREFLKLMGASLAMATAGCIRRPVQKIVPYNKMPEEVTLGTANYYTSAYTDGSEVMGVLVKTREGRPIKIESNPSHPFNQGINGRSQASLLTLYDPERLQGPVRNLFNEKKTNMQSVNVSWEELDKKAVEQLKKGGVVLLTGSLSSPSTAAVVSDFAQGFKAKHVVWEAMAHEELREGQRASYGDNLVPLYRFDKAKLIVSVDADFLGTWLTPTTFTAQFSKGRKEVKGMSRMVSFDSNYSLTGANADIRCKIKPSQQLAVVMGLLHEIIVKKGRSSYAGHAAVKAALAPFAEVAKQLDMEASLFAQIADDLWGHQGQSLVVAGGLPTLNEKAKELQIAVNFLNTVLGNDGKTVDGRNGNSALQASYAELVQLIADMNAEKVRTLIIHRTNPGYTLPQAFGFAEAIKKVEMVIYTGDRIDETGRYAHYLTPDNHALESWSDVEMAKGVISICQPAIRPMYDTRSFQLSLMNWAYMAEQGPSRLRDYETFYDYLRVYWKTDIHPKYGKGQSFDAFWDKTLQDGYAGAPHEGNSPARAFKVDAFTAIKPMAAKEGFEIVLYPTIQFAEGSLSNVSWLHELPDPITKIVWDNYVMVSLATAEKHKLKESSIVVLTVGDQKLELPVHIQPGLHNDVLAIPVGYGRTHAGKVGNNIGQNAYTLAKVQGSEVLFSGLSASFTKTAKKYELACTQGHHSMEGRNIVAEATLKDYLKKNDAGTHKHHVWSIWDGHQYNGHKWAMAVDLSTCTGCSACVISCQSENNSPVVGKKYVLEGREMHWIRIDRYYTGDPANAEAVFQPVMCQHCDNAPCETVCPVLATVHTDEGLNDMVYNRCVGTRYCANNCPYKVRRFNWFNYAKLIEKPMHMALNPSVGVRSRGVMEKCTFCVHRIHDAKTLARNEKRQLRDGDVKTACQTGCPSDAITFGDMNDPNSKVAKIFKEEPRAYALLEEWHAAPSVRYLSKIRNNYNETTGGHDGHGTAKQGEHS